MARLSEPLTQTSLQSYMFYQLKSFNPSLPDSTISTQAGIMQGAFTATQFLTAIPWGRAADSEYVGRKNVLLVGLLGTAISAVGFGFSRSFAVAVAFRCIGGALNGNMGVMRTMISEIIKEKKYQSRAFMIMPMTFNIGVIVGPILGGLLADPVNSYPQIFGPNSLLGGKEGIWWMKKWPYALPNVVSAIFLFSAAMSVILGLEETHEALRQRRDRGLQFGRLLKRLFTCRLGRDRHKYSTVPTTPTSPWEGEGIDDVELLPTGGTHHAEGDPGPSKPRSKNRLPFSRIWTRNVIITLISHGILAMHIGTFSNLWFVFLSTPRWDPKHPSPPSHTSQHFPFRFTGGLGLPPPKIGLALSILGCIGIALQVSLYPYLNGRVGTVWTYRGCLYLFPLAYLLTPYLALLPSSSSPPKAASGFVMWAGIVIVLAIQVLGRTFALPGTIILVNNSCPHPSVLGTLHGIAQAVSSGTRTVGPVLGGYLLGLGLDHGMIGLAFWVMMFVAIIGSFAGSFVKEGSGWEIKLEGEETGNKAEDRR